MNADAGKPCLVRRGEMVKTLSRGTTGVGDAAPLLRSTVRVTNWPAAVDGETNAISG